MNRRERRLKLKKHPKTIGAFGHRKDFPHHRTLKGPNQKGGLDVTTGG